MKLFVFLLISAAMVFANEDGCTETHFLTNPGTSPGQDVITLTVVNTWVPSWAGQCLGMDSWESGSTVNIVFSARSDMQLNSLDPATGLSAGTMNLASGNTNCFGVAWNNSLATPIYHTDDWSDNVLYYTENFGSTWLTTPNPAGTAGRGMDFDGTDYWISGGSGIVWRFQPGVGQSMYALAEVPSQISGVTTFPYQGDVGLAVTTYNNWFIYFYSWDGATLTYLGNAACPASCSSSYGLAYCDYRDTIFWSYNSGGYTISEIEFVIDVALERATWAEIKSSF